MLKKIKENGGKMDRYKKTELFERGVIELKELKVLRNDRKWGQNLQTDVKKKMRLRVF